MWKWVFQGFEVERCTCVHQRAHWSHTSEIFLFCCVACFLDYKPECWLQKKARKLKDSLSLWENRVCLMVQHVKTGNRESLSPTEFHVQKQLHWRIDFAVYKSLDDSTKDLAIRHKNWKNLPFAVKNNNVKL